MLAFTVYYTVPVAYKEEPKTKTLTESTSEDKELKYSEYGPIYFKISSLNTQRNQDEYNRSMVKAWVEYNEYDNGIEDLNKT